MDRFGGIMGSLENTIESWLDNTLRCFEINIVYNADTLEYFDNDARCFNKFLKIRTSLSSILTSEAVWTT